MVLDRPRRQTAKAAGRITVSGPSRLVSPQLPHPQAPVPVRSLPITAQPRDPHLHRVIPLPVRHTLDNMELAVEVVLPPLTLLESQSRSRVITLHATPEAMQFPKVIRQLGLPQIRRSRPASAHPFSRRWASRHHGDRCHPRLRISTVLRRLEGACIVGERKAALPLEFALALLERGHHLVLKAAELRAMVLGPARLRAMLPLAPWVGLQLRVESMRHAGGNTHRAKV